MFRRTTVALAGLGLLLGISTSLALPIRSIGDRTVSPNVGLPRTERMMLAARLRPLVYRILGVNARSTRERQAWAKKVLKRRIEELILDGQARRLLRRQ